ncbi:MAG: hypothetical protein CNLJKLNK_00170 [Holosporales bacterium]
MIDSLKNLDGPVLKEPVRLPPQDAPIMDLFSMYLDDLNPFNINDERCIDSKDISPSKKKEQSKKNDSITDVFPQSTPQPRDNQHAQSSSPQNSPSDAAHHFRPYGDSDFNQSLPLSNPLEAQAATINVEKIQDLMNMNKKNGLFIEKNTPLMGQHSPFLAPPAFLNVDQANRVDDAQIDADILNPFIVEAASVQKKEGGDLFQGFSKNQDQSFLKDPQQIESHQNVVMQTPQQFVQYIKDQFDRFKSAKEKKVTFHLRDGNKNLTMIFDMIGENKVDIVFRTTDKIWQKKLQDNHESLQEALHDLDNTIHIRYLGE